MSEAECAFRNSVRKGDLTGVRTALKSGTINIAAPSATTRKWTAMHIACWGSLKPQFDKDMVEAILTAAMKEGGVEQQVRDAKDAIDGKTPVELAKEKRDMLAAGSGDGDEGVAEKRKYDKIIEWLEKGLPQQP